MKDIKDYLHLYLPFEFTWVTDAVPFHKGEIGIMVADNLKYWDEHKRILLRPLSDMTEVERKELWQLVFSQGHGKNFSERAKDFTGSLRFIDEKTYYNVPRYIMMQGVERLGIESDGNIWADCDLHNWRHNQHETTRWLLSKGFDLFGLIEAGLAIDKTKVPA